MQSNNPEPTPYTPFLRKTVDLFDPGPQGLCCLFWDLSWRCTDALITACGFSCSTAFGILVSWQGIKPSSLARWIARWILSHWTPSGYIHFYIIIKHFKIYKSIFECFTLVFNTILSNRSLAVRALDRPHPRMRGAPQLLVPLGSQGGGVLHYQLAGSSLNGYMRWSPNWCTSISTSKILNQTRCLQMSFPSDSLWSMHLNFKMRKLTLKWLCDCLRSSG